MALLHALAVVAEGEAALFAERELPRGQIKALALLE
ncbi:hypothetical protein BN126360353 [Stenotrophomonas indicatrix]|nr:hypothetical protein BN126360353 [Stenotrophomonas indicatrix]